MYHDQGHGPIKVLGLEAGVNITVGLPVRSITAPLSISWAKGIDDERSLIEALRRAAGVFG
jgi:4-hydroxy-L-threonine phosphate dehydrogenase PdxA